MESTPQNTITTLEDWLKTSVFHVSDDNLEWLLTPHVVALFEAYRNQVENALKECNSALVGSEHTDSEHVFGQIGFNSSDYRDFRVLTVKAEALLQSSLLTRAIYNVGPYIPLCTHGAPTQLTHLLWLLQLHLFYGNSPHAVAAMNQTNGFVMGVLSCQNIDYPTVQTATHIKKRLPDE